MPFWTLLAGLGVAGANGANDTFKGVATLFGSGAASYRTALAWGALTTLAGGLLAIVLGARLAQAFTGAGLVPGEPPLQLLLPAVGAGAAVTVALAARLGIPVSTTHALLGALAGSGLVASGGRLEYAHLIERFVLPLLASPFVAIALVALLYPALRRARRALGVEPTTCVCVARPIGARARGDALYASGLALPVVHRCACGSDGALFGLDARRLLDGAHFATAGLQSFARGLNDTPKIAALLLGGAMLGYGAAAGLVAATMAVGGWLGARRVGRTMSHRITNLNPGQGFTASLVTSGLVLGASVAALPVSMTHVSVGSLAGLGWVTGEARWPTLRVIALSWILTLPLAAAVGALTCHLLGRLG